jgi:hypothetical protein
MASRARGWTRGPAPLARYRLAGGPEGNITCRGGTWRARIGRAAGLSLSGVQHVPARVQEPRDTATHTDRSVNPDRVLFECT